MPHLHMPHLQENVKGLGRMPEGSGFDLGVYMSVRAYGSRFRTSGSAVNLALTLISNQVFSKSFCRSQLPQKSVNLSFTVTNTKNTLKDVCGY